MKSLQEFSFDNTKKVKFEAKSNWHFMMQELAQSQKECNKRNAEHKKQFLNVGFEFVRRGFTYRILNYNKDLGMYECLNANSGKYKQRTYYTYNEIMQSTLIRKEKRDE